MALPFPFAAVGPSIPRKSYPAHLQWCFITREGFHYLGKTFERLSQRADRRAGPRSSGTHSVDRQTASFHFRPTKLEFQNLWLASETVIIYIYLVFIPKFKRGQKMLKDNTQWRLPSRLPSQRHRTEDRKRANAIIKARSSHKPNSAFLLPSSLEGEWLSSWSRFKFPFFARRLRFRSLATVVFGTWVSWLFKGVWA